jgi:Protein of unknown function (DUF3017)
VLGRALRWIRVQTAFLLVLVTLGATFVYLIIEPGRWGRGSAGVALSVLLAGALRGVLSTPRVGLLAVRSRWLDTVLYLALGGLVLAVDIRLHA